MSRSILINGQRVNIPGAYSTMGSSGLGKKSPAARGVVGVVVEMSQCWEPGVPHIFTSQSAMQNYMSARDYTILGKLLFNPANSPDKIPNGVQRAVIVPVNPATQATYEAPNSDGSALKIQAALYGVYGNNIRVKQEAGTGGVGLKLTVLKDGATEVADNIGVLDAFSVLYDEPAGGPGYVGAMTCSVLPNAALSAAGFTVNYQFTVAHETAAFNPSSWMAFDGKLTLTFSAQGSSKSVTITGINKDTGEEETETLAIGASDTTITTSTDFSDVSEIDISAMTVGDIVFTGPAFSLIKGTYNTIQKVTDRVNQFSERGFEVTLLTGRTSLAIADLDEILTESIMTEATFTAELFDMLEKIPRYIRAVVVSRSTNATGTPSNFAYTNLTGGSTGVTSNADWENAFKALKSIRVNSVVPLTETEAIHSLAKDHLSYMAGVGRDERNGFFGGPNSISLTDLRARLINMNSKFITFAQQRIKIYNENGVLETLPPMYQALQLAAMNAGRTNRTSIVNAVPNIYGYEDASDGTWSTEDDSSVLIDMMLTFYSTNVETETYYVVIDNTTHLTDDHPYWTSLTATEDAMLSTKNQRRAVETLIGDKNFRGTKADVIAAWQAELERQVKAEEIRSYKPETMDLEDLGNGYNGSVELAVAEPLLFIHLTPNFVRES